MPNFEEGGQYTGKQILDALENCLDKTDKGEKSMSGGLLLKNSQLNLTNEKTNIITNKLLNDIEAQLDRYVAKLHFHGEKWTLNYTSEDIGRCPEKKTISIKFKSSARNCVYNRIYKDHSYYAGNYGNFKIYNSQGELIFDEETYSKDLQEKKYYYYINLEKNEEYTIEMQNTTKHTFALTYEWAEGEEW